VCVYQFVSSPSADTLRLSRAARVHLLAFALIQNVSTCHEAKRQSATDERLCVSDRLQTSCVLLSVF